MKEEECDVDHIYNATDEEGDIFWQKEVEHVQVHHAQRLK